MASFVVKHVVKQALTEKAGYSEERAEKLGNAVKWSYAIPTADIAGLLVDRAHRKHKEDQQYVPRCPPLILEHMHHGGHCDGDEEVEVEGLDQEGHHKHLASIQPFLKLAMEAYKNESMAEMFPEFVKSSQLIHNIKEPSKLKWGITTDTEVHVCVLHDGTLVFAFRGTEFSDLESLLSNISTDLRHNQVPLEHFNAAEEVAYRAGSSVSVHEGFLLAFQDVTKTSRHNENLCLVAEGLGVKEADVKKVVCTGHSLGGALATLCAHWCRCVAYKKAKILCTTIGSPLVGNPAFAKDFNKNVMQGKNSF